MDQDTVMESVKYWYVDGGIFRKLRDYVKKTVLFRNLQSTDGCCKRFSNKFRLVPGGREGLQDKPMHVFGRQGRRENVVGSKSCTAVLNEWRIHERHELTFIQYMRGALPLKEIFDTLSCVCLCWSTDKMVYYTRRQYFKNKWGSCPSFGADWNEAVWQHWRERTSDLF